MKNVVSTSAKKTESTMSVRLRLGDTLFAITILILILRRCHRKNELNTTAKPHVNSKND